MVNDLYEYILENVKPVEDLYSHGATLKKKVADSFRINSIPPNKEHFTVSELCDPLNSYLKRKYPQITSIHPERKKIMDMGTMIHFNMEFWIKILDETALVEFYMDGSLKGFNVTGKPDAKIGDSIIEFKSKIKLPSSVQEAMKIYPQDFEQLIMYCVLDPLPNDPGHLIFISQKDPSKMKSFKVKIKDIKQAEKFLIDRINLYQQLLNEEIAPSTFGSCRCCPQNPEHCTYYKLGKCNEWYSLDKIKCAFSEFIEVEEEHKLKQKLKRIIEKEGVKKYDYLPLNNLIWQKKYFLSRLLKEEIKYKFDEEKKRNQKFIERVVYSFNKSESKSNKTKIPSHNFKDIFKYKSRFFNFRSVKHNEALWTPSIIFSSPTIYPKFLDQPSDYKIVELGLLCAINNLREGLIFQYYPNLKDECKVFRVKYTFSIPRIQQKINDILVHLKDPKIENLSKLGCLSFGCKDCQFFDVCKKSQKNN